MLLACGSGGPRWLRRLCSLCSFSLLGLLLLCLFVLLRLWWGRLFGRSLFLPPAAPGGCAPLVFLLRLSVLLPSCCTLSFCCFSPGVHPLAFVQAWVGRLRSSVGSSLLLGWEGGGSPSLVLVVFACLFGLLCCPGSLGFFDSWLGFPCSRFLCLLMAWGGWRMVLGSPPSVAGLQEVLPCFFGRGLSSCPIRASVTLVSSVLRGSGSSRWGHLSQVGPVFFLRPRS